MKGLFTTRTAALKATIIDSSKIYAKNVILNGENIKDKFDNLEQIIRELEIKRPKISNVSFTFGEIKNGSIEHLSFVDGEIIATIDTKFHLIQMTIDGERVSSPILKTENGWVVRVYEEDSTIEEIEFLYPNLTDDSEFSLLFVSSGDDIDDEGGTNGVLCDETSVTVGEGASNVPMSVVIGAGAKTIEPYVVTIGHNANTSSGRSVGIGDNAYAAYGSVSIGELAIARNSSVAVGRRASTNAPTTITIGARFDEIVSDKETIVNTCTTEGTGSITIGAGANTLNNGAVESSNSVTIGCKASNNGADSVVIGAQAKVLSKGSVVVGAAANGGSSTSTVAVGASATAGAADVALGFEALANQGNSVALGFKARAFSTKNVALGSLATITNTTAADGTVTKSENSTVIGYGASASAPNAVVLGAGASTAGAGTILIGAGTTLAAGKGSIEDAILIGKRAKSSGEWARGSIAIGSNSTILGDAAYAIGLNSESNTGGIAIGTNAKGGLYANALGLNCVNRKNNGTTAFRQEKNEGETYTQFYIMAAESSLAVQYEDGEACMGYVVKNKTTGELLAAGTQKLSVLFPNNSTFQPATLDEFGEWVQPKVFHPSDLDIPIEEPTEQEEQITDEELTEPEEYQPLPVYPIVESENDELNNFIK